MQDISKLIKEFSSNLDFKKDTSVILAAGHGKRIKSETSKMLHKIWGVPSVLRILDIIDKGLDTNNIIVVGIKAEELIKTIGKRKNTVFVFQTEQKGTGHALQVALSVFKNRKYNGNIYVFPGDMGLITSKTAQKFKKDFIKSKCDMMFISGIFKDSSDKNYYGRVIKVPAKDIYGHSSKKDYGKVIEIKEHKNILSLKEDYFVSFNNREYKFSKDELLNIQEFNSGVYAFKGEELKKYISKLKKNDLTEECYLTDLVSIFNGFKLIVSTFSISDNSELLGFNNKSVLKSMENIARAKVYDKLKNIITFENEEDFFIADEVVDDILLLEKTENNLDISIEKGVYINKRVKLNKGVYIKKNSILDGNIILGKNVEIGEGVLLSTYPNQTLEIGDNTKIYQRNIIKGNLKIGKNCEIQSSVNITGSDEYPTKIGNNVLIKGTSYIFGSIIEDDLWIEHSVLVNKYVERTYRNDKIQKIKYYLPQPEGMDSVRNLK